MGASLSSSHGGIESEAVTGREPEAVTGREGEPSSVSCSDSEDMLWSGLIVPSFLTLCELCASIVDDTFGPCNRSACDTSGPCGVQGILVS